MRLAQGLYEGRASATRARSASSPTCAPTRPGSRTRRSTAVRELIAGDLRRRVAAREAPTSTARKQGAQEAHEAIRPTVDGVHAGGGQAATSAGTSSGSTADLEPLRRLADAPGDLRRDPGRHRRPGRCTFRATGSVLQVRAAGWPSTTRRATRTVERTDGRDAEGRPEPEDRRRLPRPRGGPGADRSRSCCPSSTSPSRRRASPRRRWSRSSRRTASAGPRPTRRSSPRSRTATTSRRRSGRFRPTELGFLVNDLMVASFGDIVDVGLHRRGWRKSSTASRRATLRWIDALRRVPGEVRDRPRARPQTEMRDVKREAIPTDEICDKCGKPMVLKWGRFGQFLACSGYPDCKNTRELAGGEGTDAPELHEDVASASLPEGRRADGPQAGPLRPLPRLHALPGVQGDHAAWCAAKGGSSRSSSFRPSTRSAPSARATSCGAAAASAPSSPAATTPTASTSRRRKRRRSGSRCPECNEGEVVERKGRWGRSFYGCTRYPECKFTAYHRPVAEPCPDCGRPFPPRQGDEEGGQGRLLRQRRVPLQARGLKPRAARRPSVPGRRYTRSDDPPGHDRRRRPRRLRGGVAARPPRDRRRPLRDAAGAADPGAPDGRPRRARVLEQPPRQRPRPGRRPPQGGDAAPRTRSWCGSPTTVKVPAGSALAVDRGLFARRRDRGDRCAARACGCTVRER